MAEVRLARHIVTNTEVAVKVVNWQGSSDVLQEIHPLKELNHPNITKLFEVIIIEDQVYLFMQHERTLFDYLENCSSMTEKEIQVLFPQLLSGVHYCHKRPRFGEHTFRW